MSRRPEPVALFNRLNQTATFENVSFDDVNATTVDGENALHWAAQENDLEKRAAKGSRSLRTGGAHSDPNHVAIAHDAAVADGLSQLVGRAGLE